MKFAQLKAIFWMRWRMLINLVRRRGKVGNTALAIISIALGVLSIGGLLLAFAIGIETLPDAKPVHIMIAWSALTATLLFSWTIGVITELQRSDAISIHSLLHLPASMMGAHLYNYLSSFVSVSLFIFLPAMLGLAGASVWVFGPVMLLLFPLIAGVVGLLTALTFQLRGWLGTMIHDKRKRKNVVVMLTLSFALLAQVPNLINIGFNINDLGEGSSEVAQEPRQMPPGVQTDAPLVAQVDSEPQQSSAPVADDATGDEAPLAEESEQEAHKRQRAERKAAKEARKKQDLESVDTWLSRVVIVVPFGWLAYGARALADGDVLGGLLCLLGLLIVTSLSLRRSYRTTLQFVTGVQTNSKGARQAQVAKKRKARGPRGPLFVARELPFFHELTASIGLAGSRTLLRSSEFKMVLLTPVLLLMFGSVAILSSGMGEVPQAMRSMLPLGAICLGLFTVMQLLQNQFGLDRDGFRAYLLSPVPRQYVLQGKNLAGAPFALGLSSLAMIGLQFVIPTDALHFISTWMLLPAGYLITCMAANLLSILAPMRLKESTMKAENAKFKTIFLQVLTLLCLPLLLAPLALPGALDMLLSFFNVWNGAPVYTLMCALVLTTSILAYRFVIRRQGALLQRREQRILDALTRSVL